MNPTERKAHEWLLAHGAKKITYQGRKSPDFITDIGNFEVKRLYGETVLFTQLQIPMLSSNNLMFLVYRETDEEPLRLTPNELTNKFKITVMDYSALETARMQLVIPSRWLSKLSEKKTMDFYGALTIQDVIRTIVASVLFPEECTVEKKVKE